MTVEIPHLVFSTRAADPRSGSEFTREIVAVSPGVSEAARRELGRLADMTGPTLRRTGLPPLWSFQRVDATTWLVVRAVSLGLYRKGHHQLLVHGVVLEREVLNWLDANPFLLDSAEAREAGFTFLESHPGASRELPTLRLDPRFAGTARRANLNRLRELSRDRAHLDSVLPRLYGQTLDRLHRRTGPVIWVTGERPDPHTLEWLLLHFHPADRARIAFHTWFAYESPQRFDLLGAASDQLGDLRRLLRDVEVWRVDEGKDEHQDERSGDEGPPIQPEALGRRVAEMRRRDVLHFASILEEPYYLTVLPPDPLEQGSDLRDRSLDPLSPEDAALCLLHELGPETARPLTAEETRRLEGLVERSGNTLTYYAGELARAWKRSPAAFEAELARLGELPKPPTDRHGLLYSHFRSPERRWALLALLRVLPATTPQPVAEPSREVSLPELRQAAWEELIAAIGASALEELLELFDTREKAELAERHLGAYLFEAAERQPDPSRTPWPAWLAWLGRAHRAVAPAAARIEAILDKLPPATEGASSVAVDGYRRLQKICFDADLAPFALRLLFQHEVQLLDGMRRRIRIQDGLQRLLREEHADEVLGPPLQDHDLAEEIFDGLGDWIDGTRGSKTSPEATWSRCHKLLSAQKSPVNAGSLFAAGRFLARLARSPLAERTARAWELLAGSSTTPGAIGSVPDLGSALLAQTVREIGRALRRETAVERVALGIASLLDARLETGPTGAMDRELLEVLPLALVRIDPADGAKLRQQIDLYLDRLLSRDRFLDLFGKPDGAEVALRHVWENVLRDEMLRTPPDEPAEDPRYRAHLLLTWQRWTEEAPRRSSEVALLHAVTRRGARSPDQVPGPEWHRERMAEAVPVALHSRAESLLDLWFPRGHLLTAA